MSRAPPRVRNVPPPRSRGPRPNVSLTFVTHRVAPPSSLRPRRKDPDKYKDEFYKEYAFFLKEGVCQDFESQQKLSKLLYFETSRGMGGELVSLDEYVSRCPPEQKDIFYLFAPSR